MTDYNFGDIVLVPFPFTDQTTVKKLKPSVLKPVFTTLEKGLVMKKLGCICGQNRSALQTMLQTVLGE